MEWVSYNKLHSEHRGSIYHHNRTTGQSRTGYTFTNPKPGSRYVTLLRNLLIRPQVTPDELYWYTYHDCRKEPMPEGFKKAPGRMCAFYAALHEEGLITYSRYPRLWKITEYGRNYCRIHHISEDNY